MKYKIIVLMMLSVFSCAHCPNVSCPRVEQRTENEVALEQNENVECEDDSCRSYSRESTRESTDELSKYIKLILTGENDEVLITLLNNNKVIWRTSIPVAGSMSVGSTRHCFSISFEVRDMKNKAIRSKVRHRCHWDDGGYTRLEPSQGIVRRIHFAEIVHEFKLEKGKTYRLRAIYEHYTGKILDKNVVKGPIQSNWIEITIPEDCPSMDEYFDEKVRALNKGFQETDTKKQTGAEKALQEDI